MPESEITSKHALSATARKPKKEAQKTEFWNSLLSAAGSIVVMLSGKGHSVLWSVVGIAAVAGVYAYFRTDLHAGKPGIKTKAFWVGIATIVGSVALAVSEAKIPGLSPAVSTIAATVATSLVAAGYTLYRWNQKTLTWKNSTKTENKPSQPPATPSI